MVQLIETLTRLINPVKFERAQAKTFVDRYMTIKPELEKLGAHVSDTGVRDEDNSFISTYTLSCEKKDVPAVHVLLNQADIKDLTDDRDFQSEITMSGLLAMVNSKDSYEIVQKKLNTRTFIIYRGKYISPEDSQRLRQNVT